MTLNYDSIAATYDRRYRDNDYSGVENALITFVAGDRTGRVLEVGCGTGHWLPLLADKGIRIAGIDPSANMLTLARARAPCTVLVRATAEYLPWANEAFERIFCINAFHHFDDKVRFLAEARRVLAGGGQLMTVGLDPHTGLDRWYIYDYFEPVLDIDKRRYPAASRIRQWMGELGFADVRTLEVQHLPLRLSARAALEQGRLARGVTSQLAVLSDLEYQRGLDRIRTALECAEGRGESLYLSADLRLYGTFGTVPHQSC